MNNFVRRGFNLIGLDVRRHMPRPPHRLHTLLELYGVETVFDIGANIGMSGQYFRNVGFRGKMVSCEPVSRYYKELERKSAGDSAWLCENVAVGEREGELEINVTGGGGGASSFLQMTPAVTEHAPELAVVGRERVRVTTLDALARKHYPAGDRLFLKLDVQGYERNVLEGGPETLARVVGMRIELSVLKCYEDEPLMCEMLPYLDGLGFKLCGIEPAWSDERTQEVFQLDGIFCRHERLRQAAGG
jgi:FkbM family methyltransferase